jgi:two-component system NtrC family sensor kinase
MKLRLLSKLTLLALSVSAVPLAIAGYSSYRIGEAAVRGAVDESELQVARQVAQHVSSEIGHLFDTLRVDSRVFDLTRNGDEAPTPQGVAKFLQLVYHQSDAFCAVGLFDERAEPVGQPAYLESPDKYDSFKGHEPMRPSDVETLGLMAPLGDALNRGAGIGPVFLGGPGRTPHVVLAVAFTQTIAGARRVLAAEVALRGLANYVEALASPESEIKLLDARSRLIGNLRVARSGGLLAPQRLPGNVNPNGGEIALPANESIGEYVTPAGSVIGAFVPSSPYPFGVLVEKPVGLALEPVGRIQLATLLWIGISGMVGGFIARIFARRLAGRVGELSAGAQQIASGNLEVKLAIRARDELGDLAQTFNRMATSLEAARGEILKQKDEILGWNQMLEKRVEEKTLELRQAQDLLLRSRSLAALGELGSGVAHEINNPLTGVLGLAQLLLTDLPPNHPARAMIKDIEAQSLRIRKIVSNLLRFAQRQAGEDLRPIEVPQVIDDAIELCGPSEMAAGGIQIVRRYAPQTPLVRGSATQLQEAFIQLIQNARDAMREGGVLTVETTVPTPELVRVAIGDTGRGIDPNHLPRIFDPFFTTKEQWTGVGLGLSLVHKTIEDHGGTIQVQSEPGRGTTFWITFPTATGGSQLA